MKLKKKVLALVMVSMMSLGLAVNASAAGIGLVNFEALLDAHPKAAKVQASLQAEFKKAETTYQNQEKNLKTDEERAQLAHTLQSQLMEKEQKLIQPIYEDVLNVTEKVRQEKDLDVVIIPGSVVAGGEQIVDITEDVKKKLK